MSSSSSADDTAALTGVLAALLEREPIFHRTEVCGSTRADFERLTVPDYWEIGASGARYDREYVWSVLEQRYAAPLGPDDDPWAIEAADVRRLSGDTYLLTYVLHQGERVSRRATIWQRTSAPDGDAWQIVYHQGTLVAPT